MQRCPYSRGVLGPSVSSLTPQDGEPELPFRRLPDGPLGCLCGAGRGQTTLSPCPIPGEVARWQPGRAQCTAVSAVFTGSGDARARAFDARSGVLQRVFRGHSFVINCLQVGVSLPSSRLPQGSKGPPAPG